MEHGLTKNQIISALTRSPHGDLAQYAPVATQAAREEPDFYSHLIAWNSKKGTIRDAKVALPVLALTAPKLMLDDELRGNAMAHLMGLDPRSLLRAVEFSKAQPVLRRKYLIKLVAQYLGQREADRSQFLRTALLHHKPLKALYASLHVKPGVLAQEVLFDGKKVGVLGDVARLKDMTPVEAASVIVGKRIPFLVAQGALGAKAKDPEVVQALINAMSPTELVTNTKMLERLGIKTNPALRATYEAALGKAAGSTKAVLKTTRAAEALGDSKVAEKLRGVQEKQMDLIAVEGDWAVLGDKSGSMTHAIEAAVEIAGVLARVAKGKVHLIFFDSTPTYYDVTGKPLDEIKQMTKRITAQGGTAMGAAMRYLTVAGLEVDGIAVVSDGGENGTPKFPHAFEEYSKKMDKEVPVYFYKLRGDPDALTIGMKAAHLEMHTFDLMGGLDYYSLPNLIQTMRTNRYGLVDEIMNTPLLRLEDVLKELVEAA